MFMNNKKLEVQKFRIRLIWGNFGYASQGSQIKSNISVNNELARENKSNILVKNCISLHKVN
jgi:hypothetical protein